MKLTIFTQDEKVYLPIPVGHVVESHLDSISCIILSSPMSTHGGKWKGLKKHLPVFGITGTVLMALKVIGASLAAKLNLSFGKRKFWSIAQIAKKYNIPIYHVEKVNSPEAFKIMGNHPADLLVSVSCPQIINKNILTQFNRGGINVHSAPLPKYRGLMPGFWVLYNNEKETAVTVHYLDDKLDNGEILLQKPVAISENETWSSLITKTKTSAGYALVEAIQLLSQGHVEATPNLDEDSTYYSFPTAAHAREFRARGKRMF